LGDQETNITRKRTVNSENAIARCLNGGHNRSGPSDVLIEQRRFKNSRRKVPWRVLTFHGAERLNGPNVFNARALTRD
jgi:hypothetical protein